MAGYFAVTSLVDWKKKLSLISKRLSQIRNLLNSVQKLERTAGTPGSIDWPIDGEAAELMVSVVQATGVTAGPFKDFDEEIDAALAKSFRYPYIVTPGRPVACKSLRLSFRGTAVREMTIESGDGTPFSLVRVGVAANCDKVAFSFFTEQEEVTYEGLMPDALLNTGRGIRFTSGSFEHLNDLAFAATITSPWVGTVGVSGIGWGTIGGGSAQYVNMAPLGGGDLVQPASNMDKKMVQGGRYRVEFIIATLDAPLTITPRIGDTVNSNDGPDLTLANNYVCYITAHPDALYQDLAFITASGIGVEDCVITTASVTPMYWEHLENGGFLLDPSLWYADSATLCWVEGGTLVAGWAIGTGITLPGGAGGTGTFEQVVAALGIAFTPGLLYRVRIHISAYTGGSVRAYIGINESVEMNTAAVYEFDLYAPTTGALNFGLRFAAFTGTIRSVSVYHNDEDANGLPSLSLTHSYEA